MFTLQSGCSRLNYNCKCLDIRIIIRLHELIEAELTGSPKDLSTKLNISERTVYNYLEFMKVELNAPITYNSQKRNYCYERKCKLWFKG